ncbi:MAG: hypothetical protein ACK5MK_15245 [Dysgonomonas sp.]
MDGTLQLRSDKVAFLGLPKEGGEAGEKVYKRMQGFTSFSVSKNPKEYSRQYVDESQEQTDVTGYSPSIDFGFDKYTGNDVHDFLTELIDNEVIGTGAVVEILLVDITETENNAQLRPYAVIANTEGDSMDAYTYSGTFAVKGNKVWGNATVSTDGLTADFTVA